MEVLESLAEESLGKGVLEWVAMGKGRVELRVIGMEKG